MAQAGLGSRRACEELIAAGRVTVNGKVAILGTKADPASDKILVDRAPLKPPEALVYIAIYKPRGVLTTVSDPDPRPTVRELIEMPGQFYPVGRLDVDSEGLVLLTNDGDLANRLTHPRYGHEREYRVLVARRPDDEQLTTWRRGVVLEDGYKTAPAEVRLEESSGKGMWLRIVLREGRKRQIRETGSLLGLPVVKIIRLRIGSLYLGSLKPREWRQLTTQEIEGLKKGPAPEKRPAKRSQPRVKMGADSAAGATPRRSRDLPGLKRSSSRSGPASKTGRPSGTRRPGAARPRKPGLGGPTSRKPSQGSPTARKPGKGGLTSRKPATKLPKPKK